MNERGWPTWQMVILILVVVGAVVYVGSGLLRPGLDVPATAVTLASPPATATRPVIRTNTPTSQPPPTETPGPTPTPTATSTPIPTATLTPTPTNTPVVIDPKLKALGRLETAQYVMQVIIDLGREPANLWQQAFGTDKLLLVAEGEVVAGFDLTKIGPDDVQVQGRSVRLTLPAPEILHYAVDEDRTYVYERRTGFLVQPDQALETEARRLAQQELLDWATEHDIYGKAEEFGILYLESFLNSLGFTDVTIEVEDAG
jgi:hypothetical protein